MKRPVVLIVSALVFLAAATLVLAQAGVFTIPWHTIDGGGMTQSTGSVFALSGTLGEPDAGAMQGEVFGVAGGFWGAPESEESATPGIYLPEVLRAY